MVTHQKYGHAPLNAYNGSMNNIGDPAVDVNVALLADSHTPAPTGHETWSDVSADEVSGTGYNTGGQALSSKSLSHNSGTVTFSAGDVNWSESTISAGYAVVYEANSGSLLTIIDFEGLEESENGDFTIEWSSGDIFSVQT